MTKEKDLPYITKLHPVYGIKLYSIDGSTWSTNPAELAVIQERLEKGLVGSIDKRMIPPRRKAGPRPAGGDVVEVEPDNQDEEVAAEELDLGEEIDDEAALSPRAVGGSRDKLIGDALRLIGDELGSDDDEDSSDDSDVPERTAKAVGPIGGKKGGHASTKAPQAAATRTERAASQDASHKKGKIGAEVKAAKKIATPSTAPEARKVQPLAASARDAKNGNSPKQEPVRTVNRTQQKSERTAPPKAKKSAALKVPPATASSRVKKAPAPPSKAVSAGKKLAQGGSKRASSTKAPGMKSSKGSASPAKSKSNAKSAAVKKQSISKGGVKKAK